MGKFVLNINPWTLLISGWLGDCLESFEKNSVNQNCLIRLSCSLAGGDTRKLGLSSGAPVQLGRLDLVLLLHLYDSAWLFFLLAACCFVVMHTSVFLCCLLLPCCMTNGNAANSPPIISIYSDIFSQVVPTYWRLVGGPTWWPSVFIVNNKRKPLCMVNSNIDESKKDSDLFNPMQRCLFIALVWVREFWRRWFGRG